MKKTAFFLLWVLIGLGSIRAQAPIDSYKMELEEASDYRSLSDAAVILLENAENLKLNDLLLGSASLVDTLHLDTEADFYGRDLVQAKKQKAFVDLGAEFKIGKSVVKKAGITADGMVFFSAGDSIWAHSDKWDNGGVGQLYRRGIHNYIWFALLSVERQNAWIDYQFVQEDGEWVTKEIIKSDPSSDETLPTPLYATAQTKIGYEKADGVLIVGYENIKIVAADGREQIVSWNYRIDTKTGEIDLQTKNFFVDESKDSAQINMQFGLVAEEEKTVWMDDFSGRAIVVPGQSSRSIRMGRDSLDHTFHKPVENGIYRFVLPESCVAVTGAEITWSEKLAAGETFVSITKETIWTKGQKALFVLSEHETLTGDNMPVDGQSYENGGSMSPRSMPLGDGLALVATMLSPEWEDEPLHSNLEDRYSRFDLLKSATDYYIHTFIFNDTCSNGPVYGTSLPVKKMTTALQTPKLFEIKEVTSDKITVSLPAVAEGVEYIMAFSEDPLTTTDGMPIPNLLTPGTTYTENQKLAYIEEGRGGVYRVDYTIVKVGVKETVTLSGLQPGKGYRILAWLMKDVNGTIEYSANYAENTARTDYVMPANVNFAGEMLSRLPIGWESVIRVDSFFDFMAMKFVKNILSDFRVQYTTASGGEILSARLSVEHKNKETGLINTYAVSPWFDKVESGFVNTVFKVRFFKMIGEAYASYDVRDGDSVVFSWQHEGERDWKRLALCNKQNEFDNNGNTEINVDFKPRKRFRFRMDYYHQTANVENSEQDPVQDPESADIEAVFFALRNMEVSHIEYPKVTDISTGGLTQTGFDLNWKGEADSYVILWKEQAADTYDTVRTDQTAHSFTDLTPDTRYAYCLYGIYEGENGPVSDVAYVTTLPEDPDTVATPVFDPGSGPIARGAHVKINCATEGADIYYTTDGSVPTETSNKYEPSGIAVVSSMSIKAIAVKEGMVNSAVAQAVYIIETANEGALLAGVRLWPNPTSGDFRIETPVSARVEIFAVNGTLVKCLQVAVSENVRLDNSGVYFLRFTAENGSVEVRRLVVR